MVPGWSTQTRPFGQSIIIGRTVNPSGTVMYSGSKSLIGGFRKFAPASQRVDAVEPTRASQ